MTSGALYFALLAAAVVLIGTGLAWALHTHDPRPCTAGTSSLNAAGHTVTVWYPPNCKHR